MQIETQKRTIGKSDREVYEFLKDLRNFEQLMPDSITKFELLDENRFVFALQGMPEIQLQRKAMHPYDEIVLGSTSDKLPFTLTAQIESLGPDQSGVVLLFEGAFNAMMAMMVKGPITNFMGTLSENMTKIA